MELFHCNKVQSSSDQLDCAWKTSKVSSNGGQRPDKISSSPSSEQIDFLQTFTEVHAPCVLCLKHLNSIFLKNVVCFIADVLILKG